MGSFPCWDSSFSTVMTHWLGQEQHDGQCLLEENSMLTTVMKYTQEQKEADKQALHDSIRNILRSRNVHLS